MRRRDRPGRVNRTMGTTMDNPACEWVRGRLPLCMGASDDPDDPGDERGDLSVEDRRSIDRHLGTCPACRAHRSALARALDALGVAAAATPPLAEAPSLWPALERRIASQHARDHSRKSRSRARDGATEREPTCAALDGDRPLRSAWMQDTFNEGLEAVGLGALSGRLVGTAGPGRSGRSARVLQGPRPIVWASLAASILAVLVVVPAAWRRQADAEARILAAAVPVPGLIVPPAEPQPEAQDIAESAPEDDRVVSGSQLARADSIRPPTEPATASAHAADATSGTRSTAPTRFGYDLEPLTPMPPDGRDAKSVY
jgi:anti-sigma factor RsiW